ncbi:unnamed protein product [Rhizophagus irregularis]|nr:unnamed protein product [Rhizophagus irregularis]
MQDFNILPEKLPPFIKSFSEAIVDSIKSRFPQSNLYYSFRIFDPKLLPIKESELGKYGDEDIKKLSDYYGIDKVDEEGNVMEKIVDSDDVKQEWEVAKYYIKQIRSQNAAGGWEYIFNTNRMNIETLNKHLMILLNGPDDFRRFDWNKAYDYWAMKTRRSN